jgi:ankyrin repeat protein
MSTSLPSKSSHLLPDEFVTVGCLCYDDPHYDHRFFHAQAREMLRENPWLAEANIWSAATAGNADSVRTFLDQDPNLVNRPGPHGWTPLLCACYSRVADGTIDAARLLLDRGADPADEEALQINQGPLTHEKLGILLRHGLSADAAGIALPVAARNGDIDSVKLLVAHKARTDEAWRGKTAWQHAMERGHLEIARELEQAGATPEALDEVERFVAWCLAGEEREARAMLERSPDLVARAPKELALKAVNSGRAAALRLVLDLGFDPNFLDEVVAFHCAAGAGREDLARILLQRGASLTIREPFYDGTPVGWADFFDQREMRDMLLNEGPICLFDALDFDRLDRIADVLARDPAALERPFAECLTREPRTEDRHTPLRRMVERGKTEAVRALVAHGADGRALIELAREKGLSEIERLLIGRQGMKKGTGTFSGPFSGRDCMMA